jgi:hypothetical protein
MSKTFAVRMSSEGGSAVKADFIAVGQAGKQAFMGINEGQKSAQQSAAVFTTAIEKERQSFDHLRASIDPTFAAARKFEQQQERVNNAVRLGAVTQAEAAEALAQSRLQYESFDRIMGRAGQAANNNSYIYQNMARQINQVGQQGLVTGDYLTALSVQLPDILGSFASLPLIIGGAAFAVGASFLPKLFEGKDAVKEFKEEMSELTKATNDYVAAVDAASASPADLLAGYGTKAGEQSRFLEIREETARLQAQKALARTSVSVADGFADFSFGATGEDIRNASRAEAEYASQIEAIAIELEGTAQLSEERTEQLILERDRLTELAGGLSSIHEPLKELQDNLKLSREEAVDVAAALAELNTAEGIQAQGDAAKALADAIFTSTDGLKGQGSEVLTLYERLLDLADKADAQANAAKKSEEQRRAAAQKSENAARYHYAQSRIEAQAAAAEAAQLLADLQAEADLRALVAQHGEESRVVAEARLAAERDVQAELVNNLEVSDATKVELMAAWDAANGIASVDMAGNIELAATAAERLARNLQLARRGNVLVKASRDNADFYDPRNESGLAGETDYYRYTQDHLGLLGVDLGPNPSSKKTKKRGGGGSARKKMNDQLRQAERIYKETRTSLELYADELKDLNELHELGYLDAETYGRAITNLEKEYRTAGGAATFFASEIGGGLIDAIMHGKDLEDVMLNVASSIAEAALQASLLGEGPLAELFGTSGGNGLIQDLLGSLFSSPSAPKTSVRPKARSFDGGGYTGHGTRSGGLDGKGGFLAMLHPDETVVDHTKGQGAMAVNVIVENHAAGTEVKASKTTDGNVKLLVLNTVKSAFQSGEMNKTMKDQFGLRAAAKGV